MSIFYAGDLHGRIADTEKLILSCKEKQIATIIQVGDFGVIPQHTDFLTFLETRPHQDIRIYSCFGNHDNWALMRGMQSPLEIAKNVFIVPRGMIMEIDGEKHLFCGGAESTDKHLRIEDVSWWADEEPNYEELQRTFSLLEEETPSVFITHEAPLMIPLDRMRRNSSSTPRALENMWKLAEHKPKRWYFGHHHVLEKWKISKTKFYGCGLHGEGWERSA